MKCPHCKNRTHDCPRCGVPVKIQNVQDSGFHTGCCPSCTTLLSEPCPEVHRDPTRWEIVKLVGHEIVRRVPWVRVSTWVGLLATAAWALWWLL